MPTKLRCALAVLLILTPAALLALEPGQAVGPLSLTTLSGDPLRMNNYGERAATALIFLSARCDATRQVTAEINKLYLKHRLRGVLFVGICSDPAESGAEMRTFAQRSGFIFPVYRDPAREVANKLGATATPELFLLDRAGTLVFHGGLGTGEPRKALDAALAAVLAKQPVKLAAAPVNGTPFDTPGPERAIEDPYGTLCFSSELVFEKIPNAPAHHCSVLCQAGNGDLLCLWYGGSYESADDQVLFLARQPAGQRDWTTPEPMLQNSATPPGNAVIFRLGEEQLCIVWGRMEGSRPMRRGSGWDRCRLMIRTSTDHGHTWSPDRPMFAETFWQVPRNPPITLTDGTRLLAVEGIENSQEGSDFLTLAPGASQWQRISFTPGGSQPAVVQRNDGSLLALMRHRGNIRQIESTDGGRNWTDATATALKNPDAGISMTRLANGHLVLVYNDSQFDRTPLSVCRSLDEGRTWEKPLHLESNPGEYSYPCIVQTTDGRIHISYTFRRYAIKHVELNEGWFEHFERPD